MIKNLISWHPNSVVVFHIIYGALGVLLVLTIVSCTDTETVRFGDVCRGVSKWGQATLLVLDSVVPGDRMTATLGRAVCVCETILKKQGITNINEKLKNKKEMEQTIEGTVGTSWVDCNAGRSNSSGNKQILSKVKDSLSKNYS